MTDRGAAPPRLVIVGGGITGLASALRLQTLSQTTGIPVKITVLDAAERPGGMLRTERVGECLVDAGPDIFLGSKPQTLALCDLLGITDRLQETEASMRTTFVRREDGLHAVPMYEGHPLITFQHGMQELVDAAAAALSTATIVPNSRVVSVTHANDAYHVLTADGRSIQADGVVLTTAAPIMAPILDALAPDASTILRTIAYNSITTVTVAYARRDVQHPLHGYGYLIPDPAPGTVTACTWTSSKFSGRAPQDVVLLRAYVRNPGANARQLVLTELRTTLGITAEPLFVREYAWTDALPVYEVDHADRVARIREHLRPFPHLAIAGGAVDGAGISDSIHSGTVAAEAVWAATIPSSLTSV